LRTGLTLTIVFGLGVCLSNHVDAQVLDVFGPDGTLVEMPFEPDIPVLRTETRQEGDEVSFWTFSPMAYIECVEHYQEIYSRNDELAPGWTLYGYGFETASEAQVFTLTYAEQIFRLEIHADTEGGGCVMVVRSSGHALGYHPYWHTVAPYRPSGLDPIPFGHP
jgi:hypothetical protein